jgi:hypothetical protein
MSERYVQLWLMSHILFLKQPPAQNGPRRFWSGFIFIGFWVCFMASNVDPIIGKSVGSEREFGPNKTRPKIHIKPVSPIAGLQGLENFGSWGCPDLPLCAYCPQRNCAFNGVYESDAIFSRIGGDTLCRHTPPLLRPLLLLISLCTFGCTYLDVRSAGIAGATSQEFGHRNLVI